jgi:hypothetical protein
MKRLTEIELKATREKLRSLEKTIADHAADASWADKASARSLRRVAKKLREEILYTEAKLREEARV